MNRATGGLRAVSARSSAPSSEVTARSYWSDISPDQSPRSVSVSGCAKKKCGMSSESYRQNWGTLYVIPGPALSTYLSALVLACARENGVGLFGFLLRGLPRGRNVDWRPRRVRRRRIR